jgi:hypothetical protein
MIDIGFRWSHARQYECATINGVRVIRPVPQKQGWETPEPLMIEGDKPLYIRFAELTDVKKHPDFERACEKFAEARGLLTTDSPQKAEPLAYWRKEIQNINGLMNVLQVGAKPPGGILRIKTRGTYGVEIKLTEIKVSLVPGKLDDDGLIGRPQMLLEPKDLREAMYLQLGKFVAGDGTLLGCKQCGGWFERGASESRRSIAVFCSEKCKNRFHYLERAKR